MHRGADTEASTGLAAPLGGAARIRINSSGVAYGCFAMYKAVSG
jgi:hypothetical protein